MKWLRKLRAMLGMGITWGVAGFGIGLPLSLVVLPFQGVPLTLAFMVESALQLAVFGVFAGTGFGAILAAAERKRSFDDLSLPRVGLWGALAGSLFPVVTLLVDGALSLEAIRWNLPVFGMTIAVGAGLSAGTLWIARKSQDALPPGEILERLEAPESES